MVTVSLQPACAADAPAIRAMAREIWYAVYPGMISPEQIDYMLDWMYAEDQIVREMESGSFSYFWIAWDGIHAGYAALEPGPGDAEMHLHKFYLHPGHHGRGRGSAALQALCLWCRENGASTLSLRVNRFNDRALRCYQRNGFHITRAIVTKIGNGFVMDDHWMVRTL